MTKDELTKQLREFITAKQKYAASVRLAPRSVGLLVDAICSAFDVILDPTDCNISKVFKDTESSTLRIMLQEYREDKVQEVRTSYEDHLAKISTEFSPAAFYGTLSAIDNLMGTARAELEKIGQMRNDFVAKCPHDFRVSGTHGSKTDVQCAICFISGTLS